MKVIIPQSFCITGQIMFRDRPTLKAGDASKIFNRIKKI